MARPLPANLFAPHAVILINKFTRSWYRGLTVLSRHAHLAPNGISRVWIRCLRVYLELIYGFHSYMPDAAPATALTRNPLTSEAETALRESLRRCSAFGKKAILTSVTRRRLHRSLTDSIHCLLVLTMNYYYSRISSYYQSYSSQTFFFSFSWNNVQCKRRIQKI